MDHSPHTEATHSARSVLTVKGILNMAGTILASLLFIAVEIPNLIVDAGTRVCQIPQTVSFSFPRRVS